MKIYFWNLLFIVLCLLLIYSNYSLVIPKHYDYYSVWEIEYVIKFFFHKIIILAFLGTYYLKENTFCNFCYMIVLAIMTITNVISFIFMNPFNGNISTGGYDNGIWVSHYPEPIYIFIISFIVIGALFFIKKAIDSQKKRV